MSNKLTTAVATKMVERIEAIQADARAAVETIYREAREHDGGNGNESVLRDALKARAAAREEHWNAGALLASFDAEDI